MYLVYSALLAAGLLVSLPYWIFQMLRHGKYRRGFGQRLGFVPPHLAGPTAQPNIWFHAVSVGEVLAISGLVKNMRLRWPAYRIVVSTTTDTGQNLARSRFGEQNVFYFPLDLRFAIRPYLDSLRPRLVVIAETEFWPNFLRLAKTSGAAIAVVNARISDRSWPGYKRFGWGLPTVLSKVDLFLAQTWEDRKRLIDIGAPEARVEVSGNLKFDIEPSSPPAVVASLRDSLRKSEAGPILVCGSTVDEEEERMLLQAFQSILASYPHAVMILAPRHPERFSVVAALLESLGVRFWRRSLWTGEAISGGVMLLDSIGELAAVYGLADIAFVGGSLVPKGGHNIIEPARHGVAIVVGNHTENFRDIIWLFQTNNAVRIVGPAELPLVLMELISNGPERVALGQRAAETLRSQAGATEKTCAALEKLLAPVRTAAGMSAETS
ncbi:MAG TPA: 3-deoxy-D-manno-octulosonic acid transferase [Terriglobales bacterium]|nr:3-deoxy-D-manno-octulosonic acid transferase [Terriglobales bacterium]